MNNYKRHALDHANGNTRGRLQQEMDRELSGNPSMSEDFGLLQAQMTAYRQATELDLDDAALNRIVAAAQRRIGESEASSFRWQPLVAVGVAMSLAVAVLMGLNNGPEPSQPVIAHQPGVQMALSRADGAIRLYLTIPVRARPGETS